MNQFAKTFSLSACALAATLLISACGGGATGDTVAPTATITSAASTVAGNTTFTFVFSESVGSSFSVEDLVVADGTPSNFTKVNATTYTVEVTPTSSAVPTLTLPTGKVFDLTNNPNVVAFTVTPSVATCSTTALTCAPATSIPNGALTVYSDPSTTAGFVPRPDWGQSVTQSEVTVAGNKSLLYTFQGGGFGAVGAYEGITWETSPLDVSGRTKLHLDLWTADLTSIKISLIGGGESAVTQALTPGTWNSIDIDLSQFPGATNKSAVIQLKLESAVAGSLNVDNIYFWGTAAAACSTSTLTCAPNTTIPTGSTVIYSDASTTAGFVPRPDWGQSVTQSEVTVAGNKSLLYTFQGGGFGAVGAYEGITWETNPVDVSGKGKLHLDLWSTDLTSLKISLIGGGESAVTQTVSPGSWNSVDIDLSQFTGATNKAAVIQLKLESAVAGSINVDNIYFWGTASTGGGGSGGTFTGGVFSSDYTGSLADSSAKSTLGGNVGFFFDQRLFDTKIYQDGGVSGSAADPAGVHNFWYGFGKAATPVYTDAYFGGFVNAPSNTTADASAFAKVQLKFWGDAETWEKNTFTPQVEVILQGPTNVACTNGSGRPEISRTVTGQKIGAGSLYTILKTDFTLTANCGGAYTIASVWSQVGSIAVKLSGTNLQYVTTAPSNPPAYPTFLNIGPISFIN